METIDRLYCVALGMLLAIAIQELIETFPKKTRFHGDIPSARVLRSEEGGYQNAARESF